MNASKPTPSIVLVNTQLPENIGAAARACMNFGLEDLRLVSPREEWPNQRAYDLAGHAGPILDKARLYATTREAVADCARVYAATARAREMIKPVFEPEAAMQRMNEDNLASAILFGPERSGLTNDDVACADAIITIPTASALASLNVAQSVVVVAYQWLVSSGTGLKATGTTGPAASPVINKSAPATKEELQVFFDHLEHKLDAADFWKVADKKPKMWLNLRNIFARANLTNQEVRSLHGMIAGLNEGSKKKSTET